MALLIASDIFGRTPAHRTAYLHGFMNPISVHFDAAAYAQYLKVLEERIGFLDQA
jgi:hypothetical protein